MKKFRIGLILFAALAGICMLGCGKAASGGKQKAICFAYQDLETEYWVAAHQIITQALKDKGLNVLERNANQDANKQLEQIRDAIAQNVDGVIMIPQDGQSCLTIVRECNDAGVPVAVFNRPPADRSKPAIVVVADNEAISEQATDYMVQEALKRTGKSTPMIMVGDLGDPNAVARRNGFMKAVGKHKDRFNPVIEVPTKWDAPTALANLEAAVQANPQVDLLFTSSDFMYPQVRSVLEAKGKWKKRGEAGHVILGGVDGDKTAWLWMKDGYVDATGVQDLFFEARAATDELVGAIERGEKTPNKWINDPGFALTQANMAQRSRDMWGCRLSEAATTQTVAQTARQ